MDRSDIDTFKDWHPDKIRKYKQDLKTDYDMIISVLDDVRYNQEDWDCHICAKSGYGYKGLPSEWCFVDDYSPICEECLGYWFSTFGTLPELYKEIEL